MADREINAREALADIRSGMSDTELMEKYKLSPQGLQNLFDELAGLGLLPHERRHEPQPQGHRIPIKDVVQDIGSGMSDKQLMEKYQLSSDALQMLFKKLLDLKAISRDVLFGEVGLSYDTAIPHLVRELQRYSLDFEIPVYEVGRPEVQGRIRDIHEKGLGLVGIKSKVDEVKILVILGDAFGVVAPFEVEVVCRWCRKEGEKGDYASGFQIRSITDAGLQELQKLIRLTSFGT